MMVKLFYLDFPHDVILPSNVSTTLLKFKDKSKMCILDQLCILN